MTQWLIYPSPLYLIKPSVISKYLLCYICRRSWRTTLPWFISKLFPPFRPSPFPAQQHGIIYCHCYMILFNITKCMTPLQIALLLWHFILFRINILNKILLSILCILTDRSYKIALSMEYDPNIYPLIDTNTQLTICL